MIAKFVSEEPEEPVAPPAGYALSDKKIQNAVEKMVPENEAYKELLEEIGTSALKNGLTEQKLQSLLLEEDE